MPPKSQGEVSPTHTVIHGSFPNGYRFQGRQCVKNSSMVSPPSRRFRFVLGKVRCNRGNAQTDPSFLFLVLTFNSSGFVFERCPI